MGWFDSDYGVIAAKVRNLSQDSLLGCASNGVSIADYYLLIWLFS